MLSVAYAYFSILIRKSIANMPTLALLIIRAYVKAHFTLDNEKHISVNPMDLTHYKIFFENAILMNA